MPLRERKPRTKPPSVNGGGSRVICGWLRPLVLDLKGSVLARGWMRFAGEGASLCAVHRGASLVVLHVQSAISSSFIKQRCEWCRQKKNTSFCLSPSTSLMSWTATTRTAAEELGPPDKKNSSPGYEPNDHFITEAFVEYTQESFSEQRFPEDIDYDDVTIGQTLLNACRRRADHSEEEGLSSCLSSSSMSHDRTGKPVVCRDTSHAQGRELQRQNYESEQIRTLLDRQREQILADCQA